MCVLCVCVCVCVCVCACVCVCVCMCMCVCVLHKEAVQDTKNGTRIVIIVNMLLEEFDHPPVKQRSVQTYASL